MDAPGDVPVTFGALRALSSPTRFALMRALRGRRMTVSEIALDVGLQKSTVHTHLQRLREVGFVARHEDERLWVYYSLTPLAERIVATERPRFVLVTGLALAFLATALALVWMYALARPPPDPLGDGVPADGDASWLPLGGAAAFLALALAASAYAWSLARRGHRA